MSLGFKVTKILPRCKVNCSSGQCLIYHKFNCWKYVKISQTFKDIMVGTTFLYNGLLLIPSSDVTCGLNFLDKNQQLLAKFYFLKPISLESVGIDPTHITDISKSVLFSHKIN